MAGNERGRSERTGAGDEVSGGREPRVLPAGKEGMGPGGSYAAQDDESSSSDEPAADGDFHDLEPASDPARETAPLAPGVEEREDLLAIIPGKELAQDKRGEPAGGRAQQDGGALRDQDIDRGSGSVPEDYPA